MSVVTLKINDQDVSARDDETVLQAAREAGISIPVLCHLDGLSDVGACRLCLVEIAGVNRLLPACTTRVQEGMVVQTDTERLRRYRRQIVEMLFAERNHVCAVCVANGNCELQDLAIAVGMDHVRYDYMFPSLGMDLTHERFGLDHNRCILCTRCVRACDEIEGAHTLDVFGRGAKSRIITDLGTPWGESPTCTSCGKCVMSCPTGALFKQGSTVAEMTRTRDKLMFLKTARERREWMV
ncbi:MAG: bidirectional hydrogenase complex protein HoxU [Anaerolineae bacterium]|nr:bidirectional hydrogenase complex protein HoxU [Anaerolineae bacterium]